MMQRPPQFPQTLHATLTGPIEPALVQRVFGGMATLIAGGVKTVHLLMQSNGGTAAGRRAECGHVFCSLIRVQPILTSAATWAGSTFSMMPPASDEY